MTRTFPETDWNGDFMMSGQCWSTARDFGRFGLLYINNGVWNGERILPEQWAKYVATPSPANPAYGAQFWVYGGRDGLPADAYSPERRGRPVRDDRPLEGRHRRPARHRSGTRLQHHAVLGRRDRGDGSLEDATVDRVVRLPVRRA